MPDSPQTPDAKGTPPEFREEFFGGKFVESADVAAAVDHSGKSPPAAGRVKRPRLAKDTGLPIPDFETVINQMAELAADGTKHAEACREAGDRARWCYRELMRLASRAIKDGTINAGKSYITACGVLSLIIIDDTPRVFILPLATGGDVAPQPRPAG